MTKAIHTIPVPAYWTPEQAWEHIARGHTLTPKQQQTCHWANITTTNGTYTGIARLDTPPHQPLDSPT